MGLCVRRADSCGVRPAGPNQRMKVCMCRYCGVKHEAASAIDLLGLDEEQTYRRTHCRLCESPSSTFVRLADEPDLQPDELGYPLVVMP